MRKFFWHVVAMLMYCNFGTPDTVTDAEYDAYKQFMRSKGY